MSQPTPQPQPQPTTTPWGNPPQIPPLGPSYFTAAAPITVPDLPCGHLPGDCGDPDNCAYWAGVKTGTYLPPEEYADMDGVVTIPPHLLGLLPLTDPALRDAA